MNKILDVVFAIMELITASIVLLLVLVFAPFVLVAAVSIAAFLAIYYVIWSIVEGIKEKRNK